MELYRIVFKDGRKTAWDTNKSRVERNAGLFHGIIEVKVI